MKLPQNYVPGQGVRKATGYGGKGQRMLELMGWQKGQGLGPAKDGMREALETKEKKDTAGVGANAGWDWSAKFWEESYNSSVGKIQHDSSSNDSSSDSDGDACRRRSGAAASSSSDSDDSDTQPPTKKSLKQRTSKAGKRQAVGEEVAKGVGRLGYRDRAGKLARIAQHEAAEAARLTALLEGHQPQAVTAAGSVGGAGKGAGVAAEASKKAPIVVTLDIPRDPRVKPLAFKPTPATGWWGAGYFRSVGAMGGVEEEKAKVDEEKLGFDEDDQAALYMQAHNNQRRGKIGLGQSTGSLKIAGGKWEGKRVVFEEGDTAEPSEQQQPPQKKQKKARNEATEEEQQQPYSNGGAAAVGELSSKEAKKAKKKAAKQAAAEEQPSTSQQQGEGSAAEAPPAAGKKKSKKDKKREAEEQQGNGEAASGTGDAFKLARKLIAEAPKGRIKLKKLCSQLVGQLGGSSEDVTAVLQKKAKKSKLVICEAGYVQLPAAS